MLRVRWGLRKFKYGQEDRVGIDDVGIGTDSIQDQPKAFFDWQLSQQRTKYQERSVRYPDPPLHPEGMEAPDRFSNIAVHLARRGYSHEDIAKVLGGNWLRLFSQVWEGRDKSSALRPCAQGDLDLPWDAVCYHVQGSRVSRPMVFRHVGHQIVKSVHRYTVYGCDDITVNGIDHARRQWWCPRPP